MKKALTLLVVVFTTFAAMAQCDTTSYIQSFDTPYLYPATGTSGYITGHNGLGDLAKAQRFSNNLGNRQVAEVLIKFGYAVQGSNSSSTVTVNLWDNDGINGAPGTILGTTTVPVTQVISDVSNGDYTTATFPSAVTVSGNYYLGIELDYSTGDSLAIFANAPNGGFSSSSWELTSGSSWRSFTDTASWQLGPFMYIQSSHCDTAAVSVYLQTQNIVCADSAKIVPNISGGSGNFQYTWTPATGLSCSNCREPWIYAGGSTSTYQLEVIDLTRNDTATAFGFTQISIPITLNLPTGVQCTNDSFLIVNPIVTGGTAPYTYFWSNGQTTAVLYAYSSGTYTVTVTSSSGCTSTAFVVVQIGNGFATNLTINRPSCGAADGSIDAVVTGGTQPYTYTVNGNPATFPLTSLSSGTYDIIISDALTTICPFDSTVVLNDSCGSVSGHIFEDTNGNGVKDAGENGLPGVIVLVNPGGDIGATDASGNFNIGVSSTGSFDVSVPNAPDVWVCNGAALVAFSQTLPAAGAAHTANIAIAGQSVSGLDFGFLPPVDPCGEISGRVFNDINQNGIQDANDLGVSGVLIKTNYGGVTITDFNGDYTIAAPIDSPTVVTMTSPNVNYYYCGYNPQPVSVFPASGTHNVTLTLANSTSTGNDFAVNFPSLFDVRIVSLGVQYGNLAGETFSAYSDVKRTGDVNVDCCYRISHDSLVSFVSASITPTTVAADYVEWCWPAGSSFTGACIQMTWTLSPNTPVGTVLEWSGAWTCTTPDGCPQNDSTYRDVSVTGVQKRAGGRDFNLMEVFNEQQQYSYDILPTDTTFSYIINWHNTTTDTAYCITIIDTLSEFLDINTLSTPYSSLPYDFYIVDEHILIWDIYGVAVPDSGSSMLGSYGFVQYNIEMFNDLPVNTLIQNTAAVRFNYGTAITTNQVENKILATGVGDRPIVVEADLSIYPNPNSGQFTITTELDVTGIRIFNTMGAEVLSLAKDQLQTGANNIDLANQPNGLYLVQVQTNEGMVVKRVVVAQ